MRVPKSLVVYQLNKGGEKGKNRPGQDLGKEFRLSSKNEAINKAIALTNGGKVDELKIYFTSDIKKDVFSDKNFLFEKGALKIKCDGNKITLKNKDGNVVKCEEDCQFPKCKCKHSGDLHFVWDNVLISPEEQKEKFGELLPFGVGSFKLQSVYDIGEVNLFLDYLQITFGRIAGIPCVLKRREESISGGKGFSGRANKWLVNLSVDPEWLNKRLKEEGKKENIIDPITRFITGVWNPFVDTEDNKEEADIPSTSIVQSHLDGEEAEAEFEDEGEGVISNPIVASPEKKVIEVSPSALPDSGRKFNPPAIPVVALAVEAVALAVEPEPKRVYVNSKTLNEFGLMIAPPSEEDGSKENLRKGFLESCEHKLGITPDRVKELLAKANITTFNPNLCLEYWDTLLRTEDGCVAIALNITNGAYNHAKHAKNALELMRKEKGEDAYPPVGDDKWLDYADFLVARKQPTSIKRANFQATKNSPPIKGTSKNDVERESFEDFVKETGIEA